jgi:predicted transport protein
LPLYRIDQGSSVVQIKPAAFSKERDLQKLFEANLETLLGVRFIASEFTTGDRQRGRIDTLGLDLDGYPTIIEYKKSSKENIINQGLFYLDWLVDHRGDFVVAAQKSLGLGLNIDWNGPRLILVAESFSDYDKYAVNRIGANIDLWTYRYYSNGFLYLDPLYEAITETSKTRSSRLQPHPKVTDDEKAKTELAVYTLEDHLSRKPENIVELFQAMRERILNLAEEGEVAEKANKMYIGYKHGKNFCEIRLQSQALLIWLDLPFNELEDPEHLGRDVTKIGHYGTGQVELKIADIADVDKIMSLIEQSFLQTI